MESYALELSSRIEEDMRKERRWPGEYGLRVSNISTLRQHNNMKKMVVLKDIVRSVAIKAPTSIAGIADDVAASLKDKLLKQKQLGGRNLKVVGKRRIYTLTDAGNVSYPKPPLSSWFDDGGDVYAERTAKGYLDSIGKLSDKFWIFSTLALRLQHRPHLVQREIRRQLWNDQNKAKLKGHRIGDLTKLLSTVPFVGDSLSSIGSLLETRPLNQAEIKQVLSDRDYNWVILSSLSDKVASLFDIDKDCFVPGGTSGDYKLMNDCISSYWNDRYRFAEARNRKEGLVLDVFTGLTYFAEFEHKGGVTFCHLRTPKVRQWRRVTESLGYRNRTPPSVSELISNKHFRKYTRRLYIGGEVPKPNAVNNELLQHPH